MGAGVARGREGTHFAPPTRPKVAAVFTDFRHRLHAHVILENFLEPYLFCGRVTDPGCEVVSFYADQFHPGDLARDVAKQYGIPIYPTIREALCLGGDRLAVDAVLSIGEHGDYPRNTRGQVEYPRKRFFDEIAAVCRASGRGVPVFNDKHLSYRWDWAKEMADTAKELGITLLAGSSVPLAERRPMVEFPAGGPLREAVAVHGGPVESYDFHGLEILQSLVETRDGGERGVAGVRFLDERAVLDGFARGDWSVALADAAMAAELGADSPGVLELIRTRRLGGEPAHGIDLRYRDGLRALVLKVGGSGTRWNLAGRYDGRAEPMATRFHVGPWENRNLFKALSHAIQVTFREGQAAYPVERTLLTTGVLDAAMRSREAGGAALDTPELAVAYRPTDTRRFREDGATWKLLTDDTPEPRGITRVGIP
jgi:hypothetical protein